MLRADPKRLSQDFLPRQSCDWYVACSRYCARLQCAHLFCYQLQEARHRVLQAPQLHQRWCVAPQAPTNPSVHGLGLPPVAAKCLLPAPTCLHTSTAACSFAARHIALLLGGWPGLSACTHEGSLYRILRHVLAGCSTAGDDALEPGHGRPLRLSAPLRCRRPPQAGAAHQPTAAAEPSCGGSAADNAGYVLPADARHGASNDVG